MKRREWTTQELKYLQQNYGFVPVREIAKVLDRSEGSVRTFVSRRTGLRSGLAVSKPKDYELMQRMIYEGCHPTEIARVLGTSTKAVYNRVKNGLAYDSVDYKVLLSNRRKKGRMEYIPRAEKTPTSVGDANNGER